MTNKKNVIKNNGLYIRFYIKCLLIITILVISYLIGVRLYDRIHSFILEIFRF